MSIPTEQSLGIFWHGEEVDGIILYAYWRGAPTVEPAFDSREWPAGTEHSRSQLTGSDWTIIVWDVKLTNWPSGEFWPRLLERQLSRFCDCGARIAWCGLEGTFAEPPSLFTPEEMSGSVYAYFSPRLGFQCTALLGQPFETISDEGLLLLYHEVNEDTYS